MPGGHHGFTDCWRAVVAGLFVAAGRRHPENRRSGHGVGRGGDIRDGCPRWLVFVTIVVVTW